ncbi:hypothetical protein T484DRAFT_1626296 [Baffinella frigidus]|nr:hypothetical protein T484DRAFT_1626296 [Cryptophyta sp. CCMP2293]
MVDTSLAPAFAQLAVAAQAGSGSEFLLKPLNHALLVRCRHPLAVVRHAALKCTIALVERLQEEYLAEVPATLPVLVELLEDGDEEVEAGARAMVAKLEELLGESLNDYLTQ